MIDPIWPDTRTLIQHSFFFLFCHIMLLCRAHAAWSSQMHSTPIREQLYADERGRWLNDIQTTLFEGHIRTQDMSVDRDRM
ncbi:hypothetical protein V8C44DRAFT_331802 [Trichoderma aethiopicum]